jgi:hypothetical protein
VNHAAVVGVERAQLERLAGDFHPFGNAADFLFELIFLDRAKVGTIHLDALRLGVVAAEDPVDKILKVIQTVAILANQRFAVSGMDLQARTIVGFLSLDCVRAWCRGF